MTSECFVYIALPGDTEFVTAGRFQRTIDRHGVATGRFVYGKSYLARENAVPIDPDIIGQSGHPVLILIVAGFSSRLSLYRQFSIP